MRIARLAAAAVALGAVVALTTAAAAPEAAERGLTVTGMGSVSAVPDVAEWSFGVQSEAPTAQEALRKNAAAMRAVVAALKRAGIPAADLQTEQVSLWPRTGEDEGGRVLGYTASNTVRAKIRELGRAGAIVDAAVAAGRTRCSAPTSRARTATSSTSRPSRPPTTTPARRRSGSRPRPA